MSTPADLHYYRQNRLNVLRERYEAQSREIYKEQIQKSGRAHGAIDYGSGRIFIHRGFQPKVFYRRRR